MPVDKKYTRSVAKSFEDKVAAEVMGTSAEIMETPTRGSGLQDDIFLSEEFITKFADMVAKKINHSFEALINNLETRQKATEERLSSLEDENVYLKSQLDRHEQYSRRNNVRIFGVPMSADEKGTDSLVLRLLSEKLQVNVPEEYIDRSHRIRGNNKTAPP